LIAQIIRKELPQLHVQGAYGKEEDGNDWEDEPINENV